MKIAISLTSTVIDNGDREQVTQTMNGFLRANETSVELSYREADGDNGLGNTLTTLRLFPTHAELSRKGDYRCLLTLEPGQRHEARYDTPFGSILLETNTTQFVSSITKEGHGRMTVCYTLSSNGQASQHELQLQVHPLSDSI